MKISFDTYVPPRLLPSLPKLAVTSFLDKFGAVNYCYCAFLPSEGGTLKPIWVVLTKTSKGFNRYVIDSWEKVNRLISEFRIEEVIRNNEVDKIRNLIGPVHENYDIELVPMIPMKHDLKIGE